MSEPVLKLLELLKSNNKESVLRFLESQKKPKTPKSATSSLKKKAAPTFESPTARFRKWALQQMNQEEAEASKPPNENLPASGSSTTSSSISSTPLDKVLTGVIAFVDVKSKFEDRSFVIKTIMRKMGATVKDELTRDVTHVVFKSGSYTTLQGARCIKAHFVSILWIQACKSQRVRVPEKHYPALGSATYNVDMSLICSELQREYNDLIREEYSSNQPSTQSVIDKRRTIASTSSKPSLTLPNCSTPEKPNKTGRSSLFSQRLYSDDDDSDSGAIIDGHIVEKDIKRTLDFSDMEISDNIISFHEDEFKENANSATPLSSDSLYDMKTPKINPNIQRFRTTGDCSVTPTNNLFHSSTPDDLYTRKTCKKVFNEKNLNVTDDEVLAMPIDDSINNKITTEIKETRKETFSYLNRSKILSKNATKEPPVETSSSMSSLRLSSDKSKEKSTSSNMSSLRLSSEHSNNIRPAEKPKELVVELESKKKHVITNKPADTDNTKSKESDNSKSTSSTMSSLRLSSEHSNNIRPAEKTKETVAEPTTSIKRKHVVTDRPADTDDSEFEESPPKRRNVPEKENDGSKVVGESLTRLNSLNKLTSDEYITACEESPVKEKKKRKMRKLYNPDGFFNKSVDDDAEREMARLKALEAKKKNTSSVKPQGYITLSLVSNRKFRKLYNPNNDYLNRSVDDEIERENARLKAKEIEARKNVVLPSSQPNITLSGKMSEIFKNNMDLFVKLDALMGKNPPTKQPKKAKKQAIIDESRYEQKELYEEIMRETKKKKDSSTKPSTNVINENEDKETESEDATKEKATPKQHRTVSDKDKKKATPAKPPATVTDEDKDEQNELEETVREKSKKKATPAKPHKTVSGKDDKKSTPAKPSAHVTDKNKDKPRKLDKSLIEKNKKDSPAKPPTTERRKSLRLLSKIPDQRDITSVKREKFLPRPAECSPNKRQNKMTPKEQNMVTPRSNRRSTMEFQTQAEMSAKKKLKIDRLKRPSITCSMLHHDQIQKFNAVVKELGGFVTEDVVSNKTTHLVLGQPKRSLNFLKALSRGCWILKYEWLLQSSEAGKWLPEEDFEETTFPAIQQCRLQRKAFGPSFSIDVFQDCGYIYVEQNTVPKHSDLIDLIVLCKGKVTNIRRNASIFVGQPQTSRSPGGIYVKESWVLDCITMNRKVSLKKYLWHI